MEILTKRVYEPYDPTDGYRVLVDRLWPRGLTKEEVHYDLWAKDLAPSAELRHAFGHEVAHWPAFEQKYVGELDANPAAAAFAEKLAGDPSIHKVTLLYAAHDTEHNQALVLQRWLEQRLGLASQGAGIGAGLGIGTSSSPSYQA